MSAMNNTGVHITSAMERTDCKKHDAPKGIPCWSLSKNVGGGFGHYAAICGARIRGAGFIGKITPTALRKSAPFKGKTGAPTNASRFNNK